MSTDVTAPRIPAAAPPTATEAAPSGETDVVVEEAAQAVEPRPSERVPSISIRIVGICALLLAAALLVAAGLTYRQTRSHLTRQLDRRLNAAVTSFQEGPAQQVANPDQLGDQARAWLAAQAFPSDQVVAVRTQSGEVLTSTGGLSLGDVDRSRDLLTATEPRWWDLDGDDGHVRAVTAPLVLNGEAAGTIVAAADRGEVDDTLSALVSSVALASGIALEIGRASCRERASECV